MEDPVGCIRRYYLLDNLFHPLHLAYNGVFRHTLILRVLNTICIEM